MNGKKALLLVGSPRGKASVSNSLGDHLLSALKDRGLEAEKIFLYPALTDEKKAAELLAAANSCALLILAFPLYVDHIPAPVMELLRWIAERRQGRPAAPPQDLAVVVNCGFPETVHCSLAGEIMRIFAKQAGFRSLGCLATGMGGAVGSRKLPKRGGPCRHQVKALTQAAAFLTAGAEIPAAVIGLMGKAMMPRWFYSLAADWGWKRVARKFRVSKSLGDKPYDPERLTSPGGS
jgi:NAD(P)H-dependent FMN reductase